MPRKPTEERHAIVSRQPENLYVSPAHDSGMYRGQFVQVYYSSKLKSSIFVGVNVAKDSELGLDVHWAELRADEIDDMIVALAYAREKALGNIE